MIEEKVIKAIHRIEELYFETEGKCYISFSGGKDSTVILALVKMSIDTLVLPPEGIKAVFSNTGIELQATVDFVRWCKENWYKNIEIIKPEKSFSWVLNNKGKPMLSKLKSNTLHRWHIRNRTESTFSLLIDGKSTVGNPMNKCKIADKDMHILHDDFKIVASEKCCDFLKKKPFKKYEKENEIKGAITGIRISEGGARAYRYGTLKNSDKPCTYTRGNVMYKMPIIDWDDNDIEMFIEKYNVPLSKAYTDYNLKRTGCMGCPFSRNIDNDLQYLFFNEPNKYKASMFFLKDVYIAQNVKLPFDAQYERERKRTWLEKYEPMRQEMLRKYRPKSRLIKNVDQMTIDDL